MIPVTNEPIEGVVFYVQDHARRTGTIWTSTHGEMFSSDLHGAETPSGGRDKEEDDQRLFIKEEENVPPDAPRNYLA